MIPESLSPFPASHWSHWTGQGSTKPAVRPGAPKPLPRTPRHLAETQTLSARTSESHVRLRLDLIPCPARENAGSCSICDRDGTGKHRAEVA